MAGGKKGVRSVRKTPDMWPWIFHQAIAMAEESGSALVGHFASREEALASARSMRELLKRLSETPMHVNAQRLLRRDFKNEVVGGSYDIWAHHLKAVPRKVMKIGG